MKEWGWSAKILEIDHKIVFLFLLCYIFQLPCRQNEYSWLDTVAAWTQANPMDWEGIQLTRTRQSYVSPLWFLPEYVSLF